MRYEPSVIVLHHEPPTWAALLARRFRYGTSAGPLARLHPGALAPVELRPWPTATAAAVVTGHPLVALVVLGLSAGSLLSQVHRVGVPAATTLRWGAEGAAWTLIGVGRAATMLAGPVLVAIALRARRTVPAVTLLALAPPVVDWWRRRPDIDLVRWSLASTADDVAYGTGVWAGCLVARQTGPLFPRLQRRTPTGRNRPVR